eukprot:TRINITY_DN1542_c0_g1_i6.p3 TRINITY_DN1542_c0_g1~~TRINITY_DN1542_c0_g1_i6.p3  ORF type:complete len:112 (-),score=15.16 TRINITY_DN1542_c0_g1_i6:3-338(-)
MLRSEFEEYKTHQDERFEKYKQEFQDQIDQYVEKKITEQRNKIYEEIMDAIKTEQLRTTTLEEKVEEHTQPINQNNSEFEQHKVEKLLKLLLKKSLKYLSKLFPQMIWIQE